ncbi:hypothetical protein V475_16320 [Sphingobium baderi LL03]|uniref:Uncharacterized protein n=1 Tax=Sphingobium baderi LL03 TaxID=1114964 RepID=T0HPK0_9SPHN|nr:hypothetical protein L485_11265 [Sphingobium baderi LL03]KMS61048.1 hypothetical protein V475_16320 [Sphingobium baderi LL03]
MIATGVPRAARAARSASRILQGAETPLRPMGRIGKKSIYPLAYRSL